MQKLREDLCRVASEIREKCRSVGLVLQNESGVMNEPPAFDPDGGLRRRASVPNPGSMNGPEGVRNVRGSLALPSDGGRIRRCALQGRPLAGAAVARELADGEADRRALPRVKSCAPQNHVRAEKSADADQLLQARGGLRAFELGLWDLTPPVETIPELWTSSPDFSGSRPGKSESRPEALCRGIGAPPVQLRRFTSARSRGRP